eukprot:CAMPEP_0185212094 /NCGR_PEP_ID=MMETSP1140-20130426/67358_1 /TAXON_ID=298111 /ORGANISM="Pavlova sp., Strain CCMP459" /LENGTH=74 /DNA_ID=CAMNT_0027779943 /DNA_START=601 /DNA_END=826 /DNA_ORIENTATION=-
MSSAARTHHATDARGCAKRARGLWQGCAREVSLVERLQKGRAREAQHKQARTCGQASEVAASATGHRLLVSLEA